MLTKFTARMGWKRPRLAGRGRAATGRAVDRPAPRPGIWTPIAWAIDRIDEARARRLRRALGLRGRLLSWQRDREGLWRARVSCRVLPNTIERPGRSRLDAIRNADDALSRTLSYWTERTVPAARTVSEHDLF